jgi:hypothetical protein
MKETSIRIIVLICCGAVRLILSGIWQGTHAIQDLRQRVPVSYNPLVEQKQFWSWVCIKGFGRHATTE